MSERFTIGLIVSNHFGVLNRIAGIYSKRGYNIDSLAVGVTEDPDISRMTIVSTGDEYIRSQVVKQLNKLHDVKLAVLLEEDKSLSLEHLLIKIKTNGDGYSGIAALVNEYGGKILDLGSNFLVADVTGRTERINEFIGKCVPLGILELCRSGNLALSVGTEKVLNINDFK